MRTLEEIKGRCRIEHDADGRELHWIWTGARDGRHGLPVVRAPDYGRDSTGQQTWVMSVRKAIFMVTRKRPARSDRQFFQTCTVDGCVSPECTSMTTKKHGGAHVSRRIMANPQALAKMSAAALRTWDKRGRKVSDSVVREIVMAGDGHKEAAARYGIDPSTVWEYRTGRARKAAYRQATGMFSQLLR